jgi:Domain of unknown function (DUF6378)
MQELGALLRFSNSTERALTVTGQQAITPQRTRRHEVSINRWNSLQVKASDICAEAARLTAGERDRQHGSKGKNFAAIAALFSAYLRQLFPDIPRDLWPDEAATLMELMKIARRLHGEHNLDDYVDGAGYAGCAGELADTRLAVSSDLNSTGIPAA